MASKGLLRVASIVRIVVVVVIVWSVIRWPSCWKQEIKESRSPCRIIAITIWITVSIIRTSISSPITSTILVVVPLIVALVVAPITFFRWSETSFINVFKRYYNSLVFTRTDIIDQWCARQLNKRKLLKFILNIGNYLQLEPSRWWPENIHTTLFF